MLSIAVIADDLTGAADTGIQFCRVFHPVCLIESRAFERVRFFDPPGVLSVYTNSRHLSAESAGQLVRFAMRRLNRWHPGTIYKKVDSCLRGNLGSEMDAVLDVSGYKVSFVAPAFPAQGRSTIHGVHYLNGRPLAKTEMARDPVTPVDESHLPTLLSGQSRYKVGRIDVDILGRNDDRLIDEIGRCIKTGCRHIVFDADTQHHLDQIAKLGIDVFPRTLLAGSAGLASGLATAFGRRISKPAAPEISVSGRMLWVCGSMSERLATQVRQLVEKDGLSKIELTPAILVDPDRQAECRQMTGEAMDRLSRKSLVLQIGRAPDGGQAFPAKDVLRAFSGIVGKIIGTSSPAGLFLSGGDTADAILHRIGTKYIVLKEEVLPGLIGGILKGGEMDDRPVVTKAGAFGDVGDLVQLNRRFK